MIRKTLSTLIATAILLQSLPALGGETAISAAPKKETPTIAPIRQGQVAPFSGVLFTPLAAATVATEFASFKDKIRIEVEAAVRTVEAQKDFKFNELNTKHTADAARAAAEHEASLDRIKYLESSLNDARKEASSKTFWILTGAGAGVLTTLATVFAVSQATK